MADHILAIDQGTTSSRAMIFDKNSKVVAVDQQEFPQHFPKPGWVEHDPEDIWTSVFVTCKTALQNAKLQGSDIAAIGITNQRETVVMWDRKTGNPVHNAIVWQDRRTADLCQRLKDDGHEKTFTSKTGLLLDPYFSGTKIAWLLDNVPGLRKRAEAGEIAFGTVDSFLIWRLTEGAMHATDATNASRTLLFNIKTNKWDNGLLKRLNIPKAMLPKVLDSADDFGTTAASILGSEIAIRGVAGDQHAAAIGNACFKPGMLKSTYGTGCFAILNTGSDCVKSKSRLLTTIAYRLKGETTYALEGSIFMAGASVQWLRDGLGLIKDAAETGAMADKADPDQDVYLVPAFVGLGAPYWDADARAAIFGMSRGTGPNELAKATLESVCYQTHDLLSAMKKDWKGAKDSSLALRVDGGMVASDWTMQRLADLLGVNVDRPVIAETTALGAAWLAASYVGLWPDQKGFAKSWERDARFKSKMKSADRNCKLAGWADAVSRTLSR